MWPCYGFPGGLAVTGAAFAARRPATVAALRVNRQLNTACLLKESFGQLWDDQKEGWARRCIMSIHGSRRASSCSANLYEERGRSGLLTTWGAPTTGAVGSGEDPGPPLIRLLRAADSRQTREAGECERGQDGGNSSRCHDSPPKAPRRAPRDRRTARGGRIRPLTAPLHFFCRPGTRQNRRDAERRGLKALVGNAYPSRVTGTRRRPAFAAPTTRVPARR